MSETQLSDQYIHQSSLKSDPEIKVSSGKLVSYVIDLNQGSYQNGVFTIDATSQINGSVEFACLRDAYIILPYKWHFNVIDSMSLELNGKTIVSMADYKLFWSNIRAQTGNSPQYVAKHGAEAFLYPNAAQSTKYSSAAATTGDGYLNNTAVAKDGFTKRLISIPSNAGADSSTSWPSTAGADSPGAIMGTWSYMLNIKLVDLHPIFKELDLMADPHIRLRFRVSQGTSAIDWQCMSSNVSWGAVADSFEATIVGAYMPSTTSRLYVPFVHLEDPQAIVSKPVKKVRYNDSYAQWLYQRAGIGKPSTQLNAAFDLQLSASVKNAKYAILPPFAEQTGCFASAAVQAFQSSFDSAPWTLHPGSSIRNFNVRVCSQQTFDISHDYDFHHFTNEIAKIASINGELTPELVIGLLDYQTWSLTNRVLIADVSRLMERDVPQAIHVQGRTRANAGYQATNMLVLVVNEQELALDRLTGTILDFTTA
ncbi:uncharacterized protein PITG_12388 [Phytophthora infestans T30-4]|uniref:Uncharacterized protein n=1 Tax=Phytophthora infestans (strain T30-4) TaxID=403677 RepID=D0NKF2_PHYIT|nr:uncharacterized protein PITG_12388 [Phytophthora infestans T30-4]EEY60088.1 conserved hypothetical protein [Phytophthora infestans T30-4]|eukprot:XP_002900295.1 conserved hypothetical protein [Phytophthora infestans T30-4]